MGLTGCFCFPFENPRYVEISVQVLVASHVSGNNLPQLTKRVDNEVHAARTPYVNAVGTWRRVPTYHSMFPPPTDFGETSTGELLR